MEPCKFDSLRGGQREFLRLEVVAIIKVSFDSPTVSRLNDTTTWNADEYIEFLIIDKPLCKRVDGSCHGGNT
jgi:hypothetical protein